MESDAQSSPADPDLIAVITSWATLPAAINVGIMAMVDATTPLWRMHLNSEKFRARYGLWIDQVQRTIRRWNLVTWRITPVAEQPTEVCAIDLAFEVGIACRG